MAQYHIEVCHYYIIDIMTKKLVAWCFTMEAAKDICLSLAETNPKTVFSITQKQLSLRNHRIFEPINASEIVHNHYTDTELQWHMLYYLHEIYASAIPCLDKQFSQKFTAKWQEVIAKLKAELARNTARLAERENNA
jgi:hypothetical protein